ncbi:MAG TPA: DUF4394 domain-containing protein [Phnomibacter sp.]|nr:DUF4394 domain-containing protein [Phnomibacter sp.]
MKPKFLTGCLIGAAVLVLSAGCKKNEFMPGDMVMGANIDLLGLTPNNEIVVFSAGDPGNFTSTVAIKGLVMGDKIISIDFRPATGELYGLGASSRLYVINYDNGMARNISGMGFAPELMGSSASIDFNPTVDRIRLVTNEGQNLRLNPETGGVVAIDGNISGPPGTSISAVAYTNNVAGATTTTLYDIDLANGVLYKQDPPNAGGLMKVGDLGIKAMGEAGFDISPDNKHVIATAPQKGGNTDLFTIDLNTGRAGKIRTVPGSVIDIAIPTRPVAYAVDGSNMLHIFHPEMPSEVTSKMLSGMPMGTTLVGIDFRPANGQLYGLGSNSQLYTINTANGAVAPVGGPLTTMLMGSEFGFDFNPTVDRIRVVSNAGQNLRLHPVTGALLAVDGMLQPGMPMVSAAAYTNNFAGAASTELFVIDHMAGKVLFQNPPNEGVLVERGSLGLMVTGSNGFDIGGRSNKAYALLTSGSTTGIYSINLTTGMASGMRSFGKTNIKGFAIAPGY